MDGLRLSIRVKDEFDAKLAQRIKLFSSILSEATRAIRRREGNLEQRCPWKSPVYIVAMAANVQKDLETDFSFRVQTAVWQHSGKGESGKS
jgi:hypothetical protein